MPTSRPPSKRRWPQKKGLAAHLIAVQTRGGIVELTGFTDNLLAQQRAVEIALAVRGVRGLHSPLAVRTADVPAAELQHAVARALAEDPATDNYPVHGLASHGVVTLSGMVPDDWLYTSPGPPPRVAPRSTNSITRPRPPAR